MKKQSRIVVEHGKMTEIANLFKVTDAMVSKALRGKTTTKLAEKIRHVAIVQYNGSEVQFVSLNK